MCNLFPTEKLDFWMRLDVLAATCNRWQRPPRTSIRVSPAGTVFSLLLCKLGDGKKNCILMLKPSHPGGAKTFSELKDGRNSLKQVKTFEASQNVSAALQEGLG